MSVAGVIESELGNVDSDISSYKSQHLIPDVSAASSMYMSQNQQISQQIMDLRNQLEADAVYKVVSPELQAITRRCFR